LQDTNRERERKRERGERGGEREREEREGEREIKGRRDRRRAFYARFPVLKASTTLAFALSRN
jgi:hypothetical protein